MQRVAVNMQNLLMSQVVERALKNSGEFYTTVIEKPEDVANSCGLFSPDILLMEVSGFKPWRLEDRMKLRDDVKKREKHCKVVLLVDENTDAEVAERVKQAKRSGLIDQFIYGSAGASYLLALMETL